MGRTPSFDPARGGVCVCFWVSSDGRGAREAERGDARACGDRSWRIPRRDERASEGERERETRERTGRGRACRDVPGSIDSRRRSASGSASARASARR